jgi:hypothetical protein
VVGLRRSIVTGFGVVEKVNWLEHADRLYLRVKNQKKPVKRGTVTVTGTYAPKHQPRRLPCLIIFLIIINNQCSTATLNQAARGRTFSRRAEV